MVATMKTAKQLTIVIKLGSSSIVDEKTHQPLLSILSNIVETAAGLRKDGHRVVIVSSGAIAVGLRRMEKARRPKHLPAVQALAAIGQCRLISLWDGLFAHLHQPVAQILLTRNDIADRTQYLNAQNTLTELLEMGVIPIVNENDTLAVSEIKFGDNDTLSAITAAMVHADYLFLMTDVDCLYNKNPRSNPDAQAIEVVEDIGVLQADVSSAGSALGTGGMSTKIVAARLATSAGVTTVITRSSKPGNITNIVRHAQAVKHAEQTAAAPVLAPPLHTRFLPSPHPIRDRYFWLLHGLAPHGTVYIDAGAHRALLAKAGLLPVGVVDVDGSFAQQECVRIVVVNRIAPSHPAVTAVASRDVSQTATPYGSRPPTPVASTTGMNTPNTSAAGSAAAAAVAISHSLAASHGPGSGVQQVWDGAPVEVGRALVNYSAVEIARIMGARSSEIERLLGYADSEYIALRENVSCFPRSPVVHAADAKDLA